MIGVGLCLSKNVDTVQLYADKRSSWCVGELMRREKNSRSSLKASRLVELMRWNEHSLGGDEVMA